MTKLTTATIYQSFMVNSAELLTAPSQVMAQNMSRGYWLKCTPFVFLNFALVYKAYIGKVDHSDHFSKFKAEFYEASYCAIRSDGLEYVTRILAKMYTFWFQEFRSCLESLL